MKRVIEILRGIKLDPVWLESEIVKVISEELIFGGIPHAIEVRIAPHCRIDILTYDGIGIEVKKGKPNTGAVARQLQRYAVSDMVKGLILVSERGLFSVIAEAHGKPVEYIALVHNWGITT